MLVYELSVLIMGLRGYLGAGTCGYSPRDVCAAVGVKPCRSGIGKGVGSWGRSSSGFGVYIVV